MAIKVVNTGRLVILGKLAYATCLKEAEALIASCPKEGTRQFRRLEMLATALGTYLIEKEHKLMLAKAEQMLSKRKPLVE